MYGKKKQKLYISELLDDPAITYPSYYVLSASMMVNDMLQGAIMNLHSYSLEHYTTPQSFDTIFDIFDSGAFPIYKEKYIVGYFGGKMMYLESAGWKSMPATRDTFVLEHWLVGDIP